MLDAKNNKIKTRTLPMVPWRFLSRADFPLNTQTGIGWPCQTSINSQENPYMQGNTYKDNITSKT